MTKQTRWALMAAAVLGAGVMAGCPPVPAPRPPTPFQQKGLSEAPALGNEPVAKGVFLSIDRSMPLSDAMQAKAHLSRSQVLAAVTQVARASSGDVGAVKGSGSATTKPADAGGASADVVVEPPMVADLAGTSIAATGPAPVGKNVGTAADKDKGKPVDKEARADDAPPEAVKLYLQGRQRFLEGKNSDAMTALEQALQVDPQAFTVLRLMGRVCFAGSQLARGATYLSRAQALRPHDVEVNYLLGRYWLERNDPDKACYYFMQAEDSPERLVTSVQTPMSSFYLGIALQLGGYHLAAAKEYEHFLELSELPVPGYRYDPELSYLITMQWASHLSAAENYARLGDYHAALPHYQFAATARPGDAFIISRLVNALAQQGHMAPAQKAAMDLVTTTHGSDDSVKLVAWAYRAAGREGDLINDLRQHLTSPGTATQAGDQAAALTLASTQDYLGRKLDAVHTLAAFLETQPKNLEVLGRLLKRVDSKPAFEIALRAAARAMAADRDNSLAVLRLFMPVADGPGGVAYAKGGVPAAPAPGAKGSPEEFACDYLQAEAMVSQNQPPDQVTAVFEASLKADANFFPAREAFVSYLLAQEKFDKATAVIDGMMKANASAPRTWLMEIESELAQDRRVHALQLAQEARDKFPGDVDLRMELVKVLRLRGQDAEADAQLQTIIKDMPKYEAAYRALVNSLFVRPGVEPSAVMAVVVPALNKMAVELPDTRFWRVGSAIVYVGGRRFDDAQAALRSVLTIDPDDPEALVTLGQVLSLIGRSTDGDTLLEGALKRKPQLEVVRALASLYSTQLRKADALALVKRYAAENPDSESYLMLYVAQLSAQSQRGEAVTVLADARARFPRSQEIAFTLAQLRDDGDDHEGAVATMRDFIKANGETTERLYRLAHFFAASGNDDASVAALQRVLAIMPDNIDANNDLGYFWVNTGIHLELAEPMIRKALENRPNDPAFLDSLGWLYYKQGKFAEAATLLQKALTLPRGAQPEVVQHFGDTLYRMGRGPDAIIQWEKALQTLTLAHATTAAERKVESYLTKTLADAKAGRVPDLSPVMDDKIKAAGPTTTPTKGAD